MSAKRHPKPATRPAPSKSVPPAPTPTAAATAADAALQARSGAVLGVAAAIAALAGFYYPSRAFPLQSLAIHFFGLAVVVLLVWRAESARRANAPDSPGALRLIAHPASISFLAFAIYAMARWWTCRVSAPGSDELVTVRGPGMPLAAAYGSVALGLLLGGGLGSLPLLESAAAARAVRWVCVAALILCSLHGLYQYTIGYGRDLAELNARTLNPRAGEDDAPSDLMEQSLRFALKEKRVGGRLGNGNLFAALLTALSAPAALALITAGRRRESKAQLALAIAAGSALALGLLVILLARSRGGLLTWFILMGIIYLGNFWRHAQRQRELLKSGAIGAALLLLAWNAAPVFAQNPLVARITKTSTVRERITYWTIALQVWGRDPVFGGGVGAFELYYPILKPAVARESKYAHSWLFQAGAETGGIGIGLLSIGGICIAFALLRRRGAANENPEDHPAAGIGLLAAALAFNGLFEYSMQTREFIFFFAFAAGLRLAFAVRSAPAPAAWRSAAGASLAVAAIAAHSIILPHLQWGTFWEWEARAAAEAREPKEAAELYAHALSWQPENEGYRSGHALALFLSDQTQAQTALDEFTRAEKGNPLSARLRAEHSHLLLAQARPVEAAAKLGEAVAIYPNDAGYRIERAELHMKLKRPEEARFDVHYIEKNDLLVWEYLRPRLDKLKAALTPKP